jgi:hypothetical protein
MHENLRFIDLDTSWRIAVRVVSFAPGSFFLPLIPPYPLDRRLGGPKRQRRHGRHKEVKIPDLTGKRTPNCQSFSL